MKKLFNAVALGVTILLSSCGQDYQAKLQNRYWLDNEEHEVYHFDENGVVKNLTYMDKSTYYVNKDTLWMKVGGGENYFLIRELTEDKLVMADSDGDVSEFKLADDGDILIGDWEGELLGKNVDVDFEGDGEMEIKDADANWANNDMYDDIYRVEGNRIIASSELYTFTFVLSEDKNTLTLSQGDKQYTLNRN